MARTTNMCYRIGVLMGGLSIEREVSFNSGRTVCDHLDTSKYEVIPLFQDEDGELYVLPLYFLHRGKIADFQYRLAREAERITWDQLKTRIDFMYIAVHGRFAEDGILQGTLEVLGIPYLGAKVLSSALGMNKVQQKEFLASNGIGVPNGIAVRSCELATLQEDSIDKQMKEKGLSFPVIVKPAHEGSSLGISVVDNLTELLPAIFYASTIDERYQQDVLVEEKIEGMEFVNVSLEKISCVNGKIASEWFSFPPTEVIYEEGSAFFDYEQKYMPGRATKITPARCDESIQEAIASTCHKTAKLLSFCTIARIDGIVKRSGEIVIIDPNSLTGMGPSTFLFHQAAEYGMSHAQLINFLIETEMKRYGMIPFDDNDNLFQGASMKSEQATQDRDHKKLRVAVLLGGASNEREISLESGRNVCYKLSPQKYEVIPLFVDNSMQLFKLSQKLLIKNSTREIAQLVTPEVQVSWAELPSLCDFVFIGLHGGHGENGSVQGMLEMLRLPYNGSGVLASALCMDKYKTNSLLRSKGFDVPSSLLIEKENWERDRQEVMAFLMRQAWGNSGAFPCVIKPVDDGCSVFVSKADSPEELEKAVDHLFSQGKVSVLVEELVRGIELTCGVYGNDHVVALPPSQAVAQQGILSIQEKFLPGAGQNVTPAPIGNEAIAFVRSGVEACYKAVGCKGYARIDCFYQLPEQSPTGKARLVILEINSLPALTPATCLFHQAAEVGLKPMDFINTIVTLGLQRNQVTVPVAEDSVVLGTSRDTEIDLFQASEEVVLVKQEVMAVTQEDNVDEPVKAKQRTGGKKKLPAEEPLMLAEAEHEEENPHILNLFN